MMEFEALVYSLCFLTSAACAALLFRAYRRRPMRLLLLSGVCFVFLALNNLLIILDVLFFPETNLILLRHGATLIAISVLLFGFIWETR
jgi:hypothetical protein